MTSINVPLRIGGVAEVAAELGVSRQQVANLRGREDFPAPVATLSNGDIWDLNVIQRWNSSGRRRPAGRPTAAAPPRVLGRRFELGSEIGKGGFAVVYNARDLTVAEDEDATAAVKVLRTRETLKKSTVARFEREVEIMSELRSRYVVPIRASGTDDELGLWYAMPLAQRSLQDEIGVVKEPEDIERIMRDILRGLSYIHGENIMHRDLTPSNVLRGRFRWRLADFGLARDIADPDHRFTTMIDAFGTPFYMAPEQRVDMKNVDARADIYSAGKILQALMTGAAPADDQVPPSLFRPVIRRAIEYNRDRRYTTAAEMLEAIEDAAAPAPSGTWENPEERADRLRPQVDGPQDSAALFELIEWSTTVDTDDSSAATEFAWTMSALNADTIRWWSTQNPDEFKQGFQAYTMSIQRGYPFERCNALADYAQRVVSTVTNSEILRDAICALATLGYLNNRWHVRDVTVGILQRIRTHEDACSALEGLRMAMDGAVNWTLGTATVRTLHPTLRSGIQRLPKGA